MSCVILSGDSAVTVSNSMLTSKEFNFPAKKIRVGICKYVTHTRKSSLTVLSPSEFEECAKESVCPGAEADSDLSFWLSPSQLLRSPLFFCDQKQQRYILTIVATIFLCFLIPRPYPFPALLFPSILPPLPFLINSVPPFHQGLLIFFLHLWCLRSRARQTLEVWWWAR